MAVGAALSSRISLDGSKVRQLLATVVACKTFGMPVQFQGVDPFFAKFAALCANLVVLFAVTFFTVELSVFLSDEDGATLRTEHLAAVLTDDALLMIVLPFYDDAVIAYDFVALSTFLPKALEKIFLAVTAPVLQIEAKIVKSFATYCTNEAMLVPLLVQRFHEPQG